MATTPPSSTSLFTFHETIGFWFWMAGICAMEANNYEPSSSSLGSMMGLVVKNKARAKNIKKNIFAHQTRRYYIGRTRRCQCRHTKESVMFFHQLNDRTAGGGRKEALIAYCRRGYVQILLELHLHWYCMCVFLLLLFAYEILVGIDARRPFWPAFFFCISYQRPKYLLLFAEIPSYVSSGTIQLWSYSERKRRNNKRYRTKWFSSLDGLKISDWLILRIETQWTHRPLNMECRPQNNKNTPN